MHAEQQKWMNAIHTAASIYLHLSTHKHYSIQINVTKTNSGSFFQSVYITNRKFASLNQSTVCILILRKGKKRAESDDYQLHAHFTGASKYFHIYIFLNKLNFTRCGDVGGRMRVEFIN